MKYIPFLFCIIGTLLTNWALGKGTPTSQNPWIKITTNRIPMDFNLNAMCAPMLPSPAPHPYAAADVFTNLKAIEYRKNNHQKYDYPIGSMFLKTKYSQKHQRLPDDLGTLMIKKSNTGKITDWEFNFMNVKTVMLQKPTPQNLRNCINCHEGFSGRGYLSHESEMALNKHLGWRK